jgi:hypothetical protein
MGRDGSLACGAMRSAPRGKARPSAFSAGMHRRFDAKPCAKRRQASRPAGKPSGVSKGLPRKSENSKPKLETRSNASSTKFKADACDGTVLARQLEWDAPSNTELWSRFACGQYRKMRNCLHSHFADG